MTTYQIRSWIGGQPHPKAVEITATSSWTIDLTSEELVALSNEYDVMLLGAGEIKELFGVKGYRSGPIIILDHKGGRFRVR